MIAPLPNWSDPLVEGRLTLPDGQVVTVEFRATKTFRSWLESLQATLEDHESRITDLEP